MINCFWQSVDAILEVVSVNETIIWCQTINLEPIIFHCSKNYGSPTRVTRFKDKPNMAAGSPNQSQRKETVALTTLIHWDGCLTKSR